MGCLAGHLLKPGSVFAFLAEHQRELFPDVLFADLFPSGRDRPKVPADVMASVILLEARAVGRGDRRRGHLRPAVEGRGRLAGRRRRLPSDQTDVLAAPAVGQ